MRIREMGFVLFSVGHQASGDLQSQGLGEITSS